MVARIPFTPTLTDTTTVAMSAWTPALTHPTVELLWRRPLAGCVCQSCGFAIAVAKFRLTNNRSMHLSTWCQTCRFAQFFVGIMTPHLKSSYDNLNYSYFGAHVRRMTNHLVTRTNIWVLWHARSDPSWWETMAATYTRACQIIFLFQRSFYRLLLQSARPK